MKPLNKALDLLSKRSYSEKRLREKLEQKDFEKSEIDLTISKLKRLNFIDDKLFALRLIQDYRQFRHFGRRRIYLELIKKGIHKEIIENAFENTLDFESEAEESFNKFIKTHPNIKGEKFYQRALSYLLRQGHDYSVSRDLVKEYLQNKNYH